MGVESREYHHQIKEPHALFIPGGMATYAGLRGFTAGLQEHYGKDKVTVFNSEFNSDDPQNRQRFDQMADVIISHIPQGVHIITHSLGVSETRRALRKVREKAPDFFEKKENIDNLRITLVAPAAKKGLFGPFRFLKKTLQFTKEQAESPISKENTLLRGIDSLTAFPPTNMDDQFLTKGMRLSLAALSKCAGKREDITVEPFVSTKQYQDHLSAEKRAELEGYDEALRSAIENRNMPAVRSIVARRGEFLREPLSKVYGGEFDEVNDPLLEVTKATIGGYISLLRTIGGAFFNYPMRDLAKLQRKGVRVDFVLPEYDIWMPLAEAMAFFETPEEGKNNIVVAERGAHAYLALQPGLFGETVRRAGFPHTRE